jgi:hypothetical protein
MDYCKFYYLKSEGIPVYVLCDYNFEEDLRKLIESRFQPETLVLSSFAYRPFFKQMFESCPQSCFYRTFIDGENQVQFQKVKKPLIHFSGRNIQFTEKNQVKEFEKNSIIQNIPGQKHIHRYNTRYSRLLSQS